MIKIKKPKNIKSKELENFFIKRGLKKLVILSKKKFPLSRNKIYNENYPPVLKNLYNLYQYVLLNRRTEILEVGSGWSTLILSLALKEVKNKLSKKMESLSLKNKFELFVLENEKKYLNITKKRIEKFNKYLGIKKPIKINYFFSNFEVCEFENKICTQYKKLPFCNPDLIYLDGPDQFNIKGKFKGISVKNRKIMPMVSDILKLEYFYIPGTILICDGRGANAQFLKDHFKRKWKYINDKKNDQHIFWLISPSIGKYNDLKLKFSNQV